MIGHGFKVRNTHFIYLTKTHRINNHTYAVIRTKQDKVVIRTKQDEVVIRTKQNQMFAA